MTSGCQRCDDVGQLAVPAGDSTRYVPCPECPAGMRALGVPPRFREARLTDFPEPAIRWLRDWDGRSGLLISGPVGCGKTRLGSALARRAAEVDLSAYFVSTVRYLDAVKASYNPGPAETWAELGRIESAQVLVLDDVGIESPTSWALEQLYSLVDGRYVAEQVLVVTTNLEVPELADRLGDRLASRLVGMTRHLALSGRDRRLLGSSA